MGDTPKIPKSRGRCSLSLKKRLTKRLPSPQNNMPQTDNATDVLNSPRVTLIKDRNDFTPPHKKLNLDESLDDSPSSFEGCNSPTVFLSQTYGSDSPEVGWRWAQDDNRFRNINSNTKADSGFSSNSSSDYVNAKLRRTRSDANRLAYLNKREERRRAKEAEMYRAEKARTEALLRERFAKLESQFKGTQTSVQQVEEDNVPEVIQKSPERTENLFDDLDNVFDKSLFDFGDHKPKSSEIDNKAASKPTNSAQNNKHADTLDDFFNDSDDGFLIAVTQQLESIMPELTQPIVHKPMSLTPKKDSKSKPSTDTTNESHKDKRSSLYMQFLEDDEDDFFVSLDDDWLQKVTQSNKPRSPFQRYKSMPAATTTTTALPARNTNDNNFDIKNGFPNWNVRNGTTTHSAPATHTAVKTIKRHASSHAMTSPSSTNFRGRRRD